METVASENLTVAIEGRALAYSTPDGRMLQKGLNFSIRGGQLFLIRGANGSGKSTLLKVLLKEWPVDRGTLQLDFDDRSLQYIPQLENTEIHFPLTLKDVLKISIPKVDDDDVEELGLVRRSQLQSGWNTASGGERKRVLLTRALLSNPKVLVLDEPMNHLDKASRSAMIHAMGRFLKEDSRRSIIMVCHPGLSLTERELFSLVEMELLANEEEEV